MTKTLLKYNPGEEKSTPTRVARLYYNAGLTRADITKGDGQHSRDGMVEFHFVPDGTEMLLPLHQLIDNGFEYAIVYSNSNHMVDARGYIIEGKSEAFWEEMLDELDRLWDENPSS